VTGTFATVNSNIVILSPSISYKPNEVDLILRFNPLPSFAATPNQASVAAAIQGNFAGALFNAVDALAPDKLPAAFDATSGEIHASVHSILLEDSQTLRQSVLDRLHDAQSGDKPAAWGRLFGSWGTIGTDGNAATVDTNFSGLTGGVDVPLRDGLRAGFAGGYGTVSGFAGTRGSSLSADMAHVGLYGGYLDGPFSLKTGVISTWGRVRTDRVVRLVGFSDLDTAHQVVRSSQAFAEAAYDADIDGVSFEPFANGGWVDAITGGFTEHGGAAALTGEHASTSEPFSTLGVRLETVLTAPAATDFHPYASLGWLHAYSDLTPSRTLSFVATGSGFTVSGVPLDRDQAVIDVGITAHPVPGITANLGYQGVLSDRVHDNALRANMAWDF
jgi:outer membrane autotransporter protein